MVNTFVAGSDEVVGRATAVVGATGSVRTGPPVSDGSTTLVDADGAAPLPGPVQVEPAGQPEDDGQDDPEGQQRGAQAPPPRRFVDLRCGDQQRTGGPECIAGVGLDPGEQGRPLARRQGHDGQAEQQPTGAFLIVHDGAAYLARLDVPAGGGVPGGDRAALREPGEGGAVGRVGAERGHRAVDQRRQQGQPGLAHGGHRAVRVDPEDATDGGRRQVVGVAQQQRRPLTIRPGLQRRREAALVRIT